MARWEEDEVEQLEADRSRRAPERARRERALKETRAVLRFADEAYRPFSCPATAECCQLSTTKREPYLWLPEWLILEERSKKTHGGLPPPRADGGCPFLDASGMRCTVYEDRPFGCRTFFCHRRSGPQKEPSDRVIELSKRLEAASMELDESLTAPRSLFDWLAQR